jgi:HEAT repeat protein
MIEKPPGKDAEFQDGSPTVQDIKAVKKVTSFFIIAMKNYALYPENHEICQKSLTNVKAHLDLFLKSRDNLRFDVEDDQLLFQNEVVLEGSAEEGNLPYLLFRDGVNWVEFQNGLELQEITGFFKILNQYSTPQEEAEGDIVTALWEAGFPHIEYAASDFFSEAEALIDIFQLSVGGAKPQGTAQQEESQDSSVQEGEDTIPVSIADPHTDRAIWELSPEDMKSLQEMVFKAENRESAEGVLDVAMIVLMEQDSQEDLSIVLEFLKEGFQNLLEQGDLQLAFKLLDKLHEISLGFEMEKSWAVPLLDQFLKEISGPETLVALQKALPVLHGMDSGQIRMLRKVLLLLPPQAITAIGPLLLQTSSPQIQKQITDIIESLATRDVRPLEQLLDHPDETLVRKMVTILGKLEGEAPSQILVKMIKHPSELVRKQAIKGLIERKHQPVKDLFPLIEDPNGAIRMQTLVYLGRCKSAEAEGLLLNYLKQRRFKILGSQHLLSCYRALGHCASSRSIPFLREALLSQAWAFGSGRTLQRQCAATALIAIGTADAKSILKKASQSLFPNIRFSYRKAAESNKGQVRG